MTKREKFRNPAYWFSLLIVLGFVFMFAKCSIETVGLLTNSDYTIAHITNIYRGAKMERMVSYSYKVSDKVYTSGAERNGTFKVGGRYVIRYGKFAPNGNKFLEDVPVPDSIRKDTGRTWHEFLRHHQL